MFNLFSIFFYFFSLLFNLLKNSVTNPLLNVKNAVINDVISLTDTPIAVLIDNIFVFPNWSKDKAALKFLGYPTWITPSQALIIACSRLVTFVPLHAKSFLNKQALSCT